MVPGIVNQHLFVNREVEDGIVEARHKVRSGLTQRACQFLHGSDLVGDRDSSTAKHRRQANRYHRTSLSRLFRPSRLQLVLPRRAADATYVFLARAVIPACFIFRSSLCSLPSSAAGEKPIV